MDKLEKLALDMRKLVIFRNLLKDPVITALISLTEHLNATVDMQVDCYANFVSQLYQTSDNLNAYLLYLILKDENLYIKAKSMKEDVSKEIETCVEKELAVLQAFAGITSADIQAKMSYFDYLPVWKNESVNYERLYRERINEIDRYGYGIFTESTMFSLQEKNVTPIAHSDPICLSELKGYERERSEVIHNVKALMQAKPAANMLLYGDAGTGKSSTLKAIANEYAAEGLRMIEFTKDQTEQLPVVMDLIREQPLKFMLFIDDLSFEEDNSEYNVLKALLEGSAAAKPKNAIICATSNRRHLVKETHSSREGDDVHRNETIQELSSLSDRFGLSIGFFSPDKLHYLQIVKELRDEANLMIDDVELELLAERYAMKRGGRSPRTAKYLIESLQASTENE